MLEIFMPVMRLKSALKVVDDLVKQTKKIDSLVIVDNCCEFYKIDDKFFQDAPFKVKVIKPGRNIGTNAVWNMMWKSNYKHVGIVGDDYEIEKYAIQGLFESLGKDNIGCTTATIFKDRPIKFKKQREIPNWTYGKVRGAGHLGLSLFEKNVLMQIPMIPDNLFIFFGDNWIGHHLLTIGKKVVEVNVGVRHDYKTDLKELLDYKTILKKEKTIWRQWKKEQGLL